MASLGWERNDLGDPANLARVYGEHASGLYGIALSVLGDGAQAQDVVQDVFLRVWRRPAAYDPDRGDLGAFLRLMARSRAVDLWREDQALGRAQERLTIQVAADPGERAHDAPALVAEQAAERRRLWAALRELPPSQREAIALAYFGGLTAGEIARRARVPLGTVKSRIRIGLARLRRSYGVEPADALRAEAA
jgi:RNA polymerase sigma-70 factor (ECF subfamily)